MDKRDTKWNVEKNGSIWKIRNRIKMDQFS